MPQALIVVALLAALGPWTAPQPWESRQEDRIVKAVSALTEEEQVALYLGSPAPPVPRRWWHRTDERVERLMDDPALRQLFSAVDAQWLQGEATGCCAGGPLFRDAEELVQLKAMVARNLYFRGLPATRETVRRETARIGRLRLLYARTPIFRQRQVIYAASADERWFGDEPDYVFGRSPTQRSLRKQARAYSFFRSQEQGAFDRLVTQLSRADQLTLLFEGHGRDDALRFDGGLTPETLRMSLSGRADGAPAILVLSACRSHTFARQLLEDFRTEAPGRPAPVVITPVEYGQDYVKSVFHDRFLRRDLALWRDSALLGDLFHRASIETSVYVPAEDRLPAQIL